MTSAFDRGTAVTDVGGGVYRAELRPEWNSGENPNGGHLMALAVAALGAALPLPDPLTVTGHYLRPPANGPAEIAVEVLRAGRGHATAAASLAQDGVECVRWLGTFGDLSAAGGRAGLTERLPQPPPPQLPPPESCERAPEYLPGGAVIPLNGRLDIRYDPVTVGWAAGRPSGVPEVRAWVRFPDDRPPDCKALVQVVDALAPALFSLGYSGWLPTIELTCHIRRRPAPGWLRVAAATRFVIGDYAEEDAEVWDADGNLVAHSRQLALVAGPRG